MTEHKGLEMTYRGVPIPVGDWFILEGDDEFAFCHLLKGIDLALDHQTPVEAPESPADSLDTGPGALTPGGVFRMSTDTPEPDLPAGGYLRQMNAYETDPLVFLVRSAVQRGNWSWEASPALLEKEGYPWADIRDAALGFSRVPELRVEAPR